MLSSATRTLGKNVVIAASIEVVLHDLNLRSAHQTHRIRSMMPVHRLLIPTFQLLSPRRVIGPHQHPLLTTNHLSVIRWVGESPISPVCIRKDTIVYEAELSL
jgi:hypothetical protein